MSKSRNSNIEVIRILAMVFIIMSHYSLYQVLQYSDFPLGGIRYGLELTHLGNIGVILFTLISGYFLISKNNIKLRQISKISIQTFFYSIVFYS